MPSLVPKSVYFIRTRPDHNIMSCIHKNQSYVLGFMFREEAQYILPKISVSSKLELFDTDKTLSIVSIQKRININKLPCYIQEKEFTEVLSMPWTNNQGIAFTYDLFEETTDGYKFETQIIEPANDARVFLEHIKNNM